MSAYRSPFAYCQDAVRHATTPEAVTTLLRECMDVIDLEKLSDLPLECQKIVRNPKANISEAAVVLKRAQLDFVGYPDSMLLLHDIAQTYAEASDRIVRLRRV